MSFTILVQRALVVGVWSLMVLLLPLVAAAQEQKDQGADLGANVTWESGILVGDLLPNQVPGMTEITGLGGLKGGYRLGQFIFIEGGILAGKGHGADYNNFHASLRMDMPVQMLVGMVYLGADNTYYKGVDRKKKMFGGAHVGGGVMAHLGGSVWLRGDMKFTINPGTSLFIGCGIMFRFGGGGGGGA